MKYKIKGNRISFQIDRRIYSDTVVTKMLYWLSEDYTIERFLDELGNYEDVLIYSKNEFEIEEAEKLYKKINQELLDYKLRDIVNIETKDIRTILYIKAFSNNENLIDFEIS